MPAHTHTIATPRSGSASADEVFSDIEANAAVASRFTLRWRRSVHRGRYSDAGWEWTCGDEPDDRNPDAIFESMLAQAEELEGSAGCPCRFQLVCYAMREGETERSGPPVSFTLSADESADVAATTSALEGMSKVLRDFQSLVIRQNAQIDRLTGSVTKMAEGMAAYSGPAIELRRMEYERDRDERERQAERDDDEHEMEMVKDLAGKALLFLTAKEARKHGNGEEAWVYAIRAARELATRPEVQDVLGEDGIAMLVALGDAKDRQGAEAVFMSLCDYVRGNDLGDELLAAAPELAPFANFFS